MSQHRWLELFEAYGLTILYSFGNANMVADTLCQKVINMMSLAHNFTQERPLNLEVQSLAN